MDRGLHLRRYFRPVLSILKPASTKLGVVSRKWLEQLGEIRVQVTRVSSTM